MNDLERRQIIIDYISNKQGCKAEDIVEGVKKDISRVPVFSILQDLVKDGAVRDDKINRRDHRYFVDVNNLLIAVPRQLEDFEKAYFSLIDKLKEKFHDPGSKNRYSIFQKYGVFSDVISIYEFVIQLYLMCGIYVWPKRISDNESLSKLYTMLFSKLFQMQLKLANVNRTMLGEYDVIEAMILNSSIPSITKEFMLKSSEEFNSVKELEAVMSIVDNIRSGLRKEAFNRAGGKIRIGGRGNSAYCPFKTAGGKIVVPNEDQK